MKNSNKVASRDKFVVLCTSFFLQFSVLCYTLVLFILTAYISSLYLIPQVKKYYFVINFIYRLVHISMWNELCLLCQKAKYFVPVVQVTFPFSHDFYQQCLPKAYDFIFHATHKCSKNASHAHRISVGNDD